VHDELRLSVNVFCCGLFQTDEYTTRRQNAAVDGTAPSLWHPTHTYHGFRYVQLDGWPDSVAEPNISTLVAHFVHTAVDVAGTVAFDSRSGGSSASLPTQLNALQEAIQFTQLSNIYSIPTDCPQREKRGWVRGWMLG